MTGTDQESQVQIVDMDKCFEPNEIGLPRGSVNPKSTRPPSVPDVTFRPKLG